MKKITFCLAALAIALMSSISSHSQDEPPPPPPKPPKVVMRHPGKVTVDDFYENNPSVSKVYADKDKRIMIELKDGTKERYNMKDETEKKNFSTKYGKVPLLPPPPPPPPKKVI